MKLWKDGRPWEVHPRSSCSIGGCGHPHFDYRAAQLWLWPFLTDPRTMEELRRLLVQLDGGSRQSIAENNQVIPRVAAYLEHGWLCLAPDVLAGSTNTPGTVSSDGAGAPPPEDQPRVPRTARQSSSGPAPEEPTFVPDIEAAQIAAAMQEAARLGVPFCEECTKARLRQQKQQPVGAGV